MPVLFIFLLKVNVALLLFCAGYYMVLRHITFYTLNRIYLVAAILFATIYPEINLSGFLQQHEQIAKPVEAVAINWQAPTTALVKPLTVPAYWNWIELIFWIGVILLALRLIMRLYSLYKLYSSSTAAQIHEHDVRLVNTDSGPFSFWKSIYVNPANIKPADLKSILMHEQVHVNEWHTLDILIAELSTIFYWFNPGVWLMKKAIRENIEFITDRKIIKSGADTKQYQYSLVSVSFAASPNTIFNHFNISAIKKRIIMMNAEQSSKFTLSRYAFLVPAVVAMLLVFSISKAAFVKKSTLVNHQTASVMLITPVQKPVKRPRVKIDSAKKTAITANINLSIDTQSMRNTTTSPWNNKVVDSSLKTNSIVIDKNGAINITQNGAPIKPLMYVVDGNISKNYDHGKLNKANIKSIDVGETLDKKTIVYIKTKNGIETAPIIAIRINGESARHTQGKLIDGKLAVIDTVKIVNRRLILDTTYLTKAHASTLSTAPGNAKMISSLTWSKSSLQIKPVLKVHAEDSVIRRPNGISCFFGKAEVTYGTTNVKADYIEYDSKANTIKAKGAVIVTQKQNNETLTSTASDFLWQLNK
ncbi:M56 family metallopeptidase [Mucilaginibacter sp. BJC16-A38]|uniref:M56 family metallopeptidase n=1 Tax=Mucilaginibacter phenanthrenivorans TaxID=1234842 RepID=UPI00215712A4|nr:M56 family metallopeptidase [Mucilaginibacter phenanthrenivorans]MCR8556090.1 M56 family metallopeptidase [Mucilaginibacter phenanthrenivorans]